MNLPSLKPLNKVSVATLAGLVLAFAFWILRRYTTVDIDAEGVAVITALVAGLSGYLTPLSTAEVVQIVQSPEAPAQMPIARTDERKNL